MSEKTVNLYMLSGTIQSAPDTSSKGIKFDLLSVTKRSKERDYEERAQVTVRAMGDLAYACSGLKIGDRIYVEGKISNRSKELPSGKKHYWTELIAKDIQKI